MAPKTGVPRLWKLRSRTSVENGTLVLILEGRLGQATANDLRAAIESARNGQSSDLVIDLARVDYLSSAAIKVFEDLGEGRLTFRSPSPAARLSLEFAGFSLGTK